MQMPERARIRALKEEVIKRIEEANVRNFPGCEGKLFLISTAYIFPLLRELTSHCMRQRRSTARVVGKKCSM